MAENPFRLCLDGLYSVQRAQEVCCALPCVRTVWKAKKSSQFRHISPKVVQRSLSKQTASHSRAEGVSAVIPCAQGTPGSIVIFNT